MQGRLDMTADANAPLGAYTRTQLWLIDEAPPHFGSARWRRPRRSRATWCAAIAPVELHAAGQEPRDQGSALKGCTGRAEG